jgi:hypothetical protein
MSLQQPSKSVSASPSVAQQYYNDPTLPTRRLQAMTQFGGRASTAAYGGQTHAVSDPFSSQTGFKTGFMDTGRMLTGVIMDGTAIANVYIVHPDHGHDPLLATAVTHGSSACFGSTEINTYVPGTRVIVMVQDKDNKGFIIGAVPHTTDVGKRVMHDYISQASRNRVDDCHKKHIKQEKSCGIADYSNWRPYDATLGGEWGAITSTGLRITVDDFMLQAAVNEFCGVYGFYHDSMLRIAGYNMQVWTAGSERDSYMDQAECNDSQGYTPYPWEGMGVLIPGPPVIEEYEPGCYHCFKEKPYYSRWENKHEFAQPYHRTQVFQGYLGQGHRTIVHAPPPGKDRWTYKGQPGGKGPTPFDSEIVTPRGTSYNCQGGPDKDKDHDPQPVFGLNEENKALDGRIFMASAKGIHIAKRILLPFPQREKRPEDYQNGDDAEKEYKAASKYGAGEEHPITGTIKTTDEQYPNLQRATAVLDMHGYLYNYSGLHAFYWHAKDYKTWEQQELKYADVNQKIPKFKQLMSSKMYLKEEEPKIFKIDHRYDKNPQKFYESESYISLLEDGGICIGDGYGGEIRMTGGCVFISAPGDVWLKGGRDVQAWAGNDFIARANNTVDISATEKNVRIKAERNVLVLAGNDTSDREGGILLESRGKITDYLFEECGDDIIFAGVNLRAPYANVVGLAKNIYLRTGGGKIEDGDITIDASQSRRDILTKSRNFFNFVRSAVFHFFGSGDDKWSTDKANMFAKNFTLLVGPIGTDGDLLMDGNILARGSCLLTKGHIFTEIAARGFIFVAPCDGDCQGEVNAIIDLIVELINTTVPKIGDAIHKAQIEEFWYKYPKAGNSRIMTIMEFSFRTDEQYKIPDFLLYEDRWQQMARIGNQIPDRWTEKPVKAEACGVPTYPFPGKKWLQDQPAYKEQDFKIVQFQKGGFIDLERGKAPGLAGPYKEPELVQAKDKIINGNYVITPRK